jgi:hypothetical protein
VPFTIPPAKLTINKVSNSDSVQTLRTKFLMIVETGQARWDVIVSWKALLGNGPASSDYWQEWEKVRRILAIFKAAPFVEVENEHIRDVIPSDANDASMRLAFALRQFSISTCADIVDGLDCILHMTLFNYLPYSHDFGYVVGEGISAGAALSDNFHLYLDTWIQENLDTVPSLSNAPAEGNHKPLDWKQQTPGSLKMTYREYVYQTGRPGLSPSRRFLSPSLSAAAGRFPEARNAVRRGAYMAARAGRVKSGRKPVGEAGGGVLEGA